ncbi:hypothetical protein ACRALDRAFT_1045635 [Sodiomyces alcalophilus JCM 7366]|uniref:uncharacterized protein n=1 Tax=Sodiomyces alcalophilus JCM 7366 TaxID=591952 RepID=UPI0039B6D335
MSSLSEKPPLESQHAVTQATDDPGSSQPFKNRSFTVSPAVQQVTSTPTPGGLSPYNSSLPRTSPSHARPWSLRSPASKEPRSTSSTPTLLHKASTSSLRSATGSVPCQDPSRRSSLIPTSSPTPKFPFPSAISGGSPKPVLTASSVASDYFKAELELHHGPDSNTPADVVVVIHDACYGHRLSRPQTSRAALCTIVDRPESIRASALGVAMAYVRLGQRHSGGSYPIHPNLDPATVPIPFQILRTTRRLPLASPAVTNIHGAKWVEEVTVMCNSAQNKLAMGGIELQTPEMNAGSDQHAPAESHERDLCLCAESLDALEAALGAVCEAVDRVFTSGPRRAFVAVRPPGHHCLASFPAGFCWINNVHVGIMHAILDYGLTHAAIIDFDLHHGDGSQAITWQQNARASAASKNAAAWKKASIGYFSLHDINSYPCEAGDEDKVRNASLCIENAHGQTIWNVHLQAWASEAEFWEIYETRYVVLLDKVRAYLKRQSIRLRAAQQQPKAAIFFAAGFDASEWEMKGMQRQNVNVPTGFYARMTQDVVRMAAEEGLDVSGRVISVLEGGYSDPALSSGVFSHVSGLVGSAQSMSIEDRSDGCLEYEMGHRTRMADEGQLGIQSIVSQTSLQLYDPSWWSSTVLHDLEAAMRGEPKPPRPRRSVPSTYSSPTQASTAKAVHLIKSPRGISGLSSRDDVASCPPAEPHPPVSWTTAVHELSKHLICIHRQTESCKVKDLNAEASRARKSRQPLLNSSKEPPGAVAPSSTTSRMSLRHRKPIRNLAGGRRATAACDDERDRIRNTVVESSVPCSGKMLSGTVSALSGQSDEKPAVGLRARSPNAFIVPGSATGQIGVLGEQRPRARLRRGTAPATDVIQNSNSNLRKTMLPATRREGTERAP